MKPLLEKIRKDKDFRSVLTMAGSAGFNMVYGVFSLIVGIIATDMHLISSGGYYFLLAAIEAWLLFKRKTISGTRAVGLALLVLDLSISGMTFYSLFASGVKGQDTITMIAIAAYTFIRIGLAVKAFLDREKSRDALSVMMRSVSFFSVSVAVLTLTISMIATFSGGFDRSSTILVAIVGMAVFLLNLSIAVYLVFRRSNPKDPADLKSDGDLK